VARFPVLPVALVALVAAAPAGAQSTPSQFLESGTITPYTTRDHPFVTTTSLVRGRDYRLVMTGLWHVQWPAGPDTPAYEEQDDSLYCRHQNPVPKPQNGDCNGIYYKNWNGVRAQIGNDPNPMSIYQIYPSSSTVPTPNYAYDVIFRAKYDGILKFWDPYAGFYGESDGPSSATGSFGFQLYSVGQAQPPPASGGTTGTSPPSSRPTVSSRPAPGRVTLRIRCPQSCFVSATMEAFLDGRLVGARSRNQEVASGLTGVFNLRLRGRPARRVAAAIRRHRRGKLVVKLSFLYDDGTRRNRTLTFPLSGAPATASWGGSWTSDFGPLTLRQSGSRVTGTYPTCNGSGTGTITATASGRTLDGTWSQACNSRSGRLHFVQSSGGGSFSGKWSYGEATPTSTWNGRRA
jgi:hypothetical protein